MDLHSSRGPVIVILLLYMDLCKAATSMENIIEVWRQYTGQLLEANSSYYGYYQGGGACSLDPLTTDYSHKGWIKVAAGDGEFQKSLGCGMCVEIRGRGILAQLVERGKIPKTPIIGPINAFVIDRCGNCQRGFDLYAPGYDVWRTKFKAIECPKVPGTNGNIKFRFLSSNPWAMKIQPRNARVVTVGFEIFHKGKWLCLSRTDDNFFVAGSKDRINFPMRVRLTSISGELLETTIPELKNDVDIPSSIQFSGFIAGSDPRSIKCYGQNPEPSNANSLLDEAFCMGRQDGTYYDPEDCTAFYQCVRGSAFRKHCPKGTVFNELQKACDNAVNFPCSQRARIEMAKLAANNPTVKRLGTMDSATTLNVFRKVDDLYCRGKHDGTYVDPTDCTAYFRCVKGSAYRRYCARGTVFNDHLKICDNPVEFPCQQNTQVKQFNAGITGQVTFPLDHKANANKEDTAFNVSKQVIASFCEGKSDGFYRDPTECNAFYQCLRGQASRRHCLRGMIYNPLVESCDKFQHFPCPLEESTPGPAVNSAVKQNIGQGFDVNKMQSFDILTGLTTYGHGNSAGTFTQSSDSNANLGNTSKTPVVNKHFCDGRPNGNYADPGDCAGFYTCTEGKTLKQSCPKQLRYNFTTGECDWPKNVKCPQLTLPKLRQMIHNAKNSEDRAITIHGLIKKITAVAKKQDISQPKSDFSQEIVK